MNSSEKYNVIVMVKQPIFNYVYIYLSVINVGVNTENKFFFYNKFSSSLRITLVWDHYSELKFAYFRS